MSMETAWRQWRLVWGERTMIMGIVNLTDDSFSGDGLAGDVAGAVAQARRFVDEGADIIDIGGESTRPGYTPVDADEELRRVVPAVAAVAAAVRVPVSIDTRKPAVARAALQAGAHLLNDVDATLDGGPMFRVAAEYGVPIVMVHNKPQALYDDLLGEVTRSLQAACLGGFRSGSPRGAPDRRPGPGIRQNRCAQSAPVA